jgi:membrane protein required for colicin V production
MDDFPVNPIDILVALVLLVSALLAFARGAVREVLGVGSWVGAAFAAVFGFPYAREFSRQVIESQLVADAVAGLAVFLVALVLLAVVSQILAGRIQGSRFGAVDRAVGFVFGLVRGAVLLCLAYMLFIWAMAEEDRPPWIAKARTLPYIVKGAEAIRSIVPDALEEQARTAVRNESKLTTDALSALRRYEELQGRARETPPPPQPPPAGTQ